VLQIWRPIRLKDHLRHPLGDFFSLLPTTTWNACLTSSRRALRFNLMNTRFAAKWPSLPVQRASRPHAWYESRRRWKGEDPPHSIRRQTAIRVPAAYLMSLQSNAPNIVAREFTSIGIRLQSSYRPPQLSFPALTTHYWTCVGHAVTGPSDMLCIPTLCCPALHCPPHS
jgi:hypothetical protein